MYQITEIERNGAVLPWVRLVSTHDDARNKVRLTVRDPETGHQIRVEGEDTYLSPSGIQKACDGKYPDGFFPIFECGSYNVYLMTDAVMSDPALRFVRYAGMDTYDELDSKISVYFILRGIQKIRPVKYAGYAGKCVTASAGDDYANMSLSDMLRTNLRNAYINDDRLYFMKTPWQDTAHINRQEVWEYRITDMEAFKKFARAI